MKFFILISLLMFLSCQKKLTKQEEATIFAGKAMQDIASGMMAEVQKAVDTMGAKKAVLYCRDFVPGYTQEKLATWSQKAREELGANSFRFRRISLRNRNPANTPNELEKAILEDWEKTGRAQPTGYERDGKIITLHPIKIASPLCLNCHGKIEQMNPDIVKEIRRLYPNDLAVGYSLGELRGAFLSEFTFPNEPK